MDITFTPVSEIGEFGLIDKFSSIASRFSNPAVERSIGDDAAVIKPTPGNLELITTDVLIQGIHFDLSYTSMKHLGRKAAAANLSDIAAMSGIPVAAFISMGIHSNLSVEMLQEFYEAFVDELGKQGCAVAGGDTSGSPVGFVVSVTIAGEVEPERRVFRSGAKAGDVVCVTGDLGRAHAGMKILQREKNRYLELGQPADFKPNFDGFDDALQKHLLPEPRIALSRTISEKIKINSMIDVSDGLAGDMLHICKESGVAAELNEEFIPIDPVTRKIADEFKEDALSYALTGGEDYELLFTISEEDFRKLYSLEGNIRVIGRIKEGAPAVTVRRIDGTSVEHTDFPGYQHFSKTS